LNGKSSLSPRRKQGRAPLSRPDFAPRENLAHRSPSVIGSDSSERSARGPIGAFQMGGRFLVTFITRVEFGHAFCKVAQSTPTIADNPQVRDFTDCSD
jgi:hypothetical protein